MIYTAMSRDSIQSAPKTRPKVFGKGAKAPRFHAKYSATGPKSVSKWIDEERHKNITVAPNTNHQDIERPERVRSICQTNARTNSPASTSVRQEWLEKKNARVAASS